MIPHLVHTSSQYHTRGGMVPHWYINIVSYHITDTSVWYGIIWYQLIYQCGRVPCGMVPSWYINVVGYPGMVPHWYISVVRYHMVWYPVVWYHDWCIPWYGTLWYGTTTDIYPWYGTSGMVLSGTYSHTILSHDSDADEHQTNFCPSCGMFAGLTHDYTFINTWNIPQLGQKLVWCSSASESCDSMVWEYVPQSTIPEVPYQGYHTTLIYQCGTLPRGTIYQRYHGIIPQGTIPGDTSVVVPYHRVPYLGIHQSWYHTMGFEGMVWYVGIIRVMVWLVGLVGYGMVWVWYHIDISVWYHTMWYHTMLIYQLVLYDAIPH
jgi:hypothetical protein